MRSEARRKLPASATRIAYFRYFRSSVRSGIELNQSPAADSSDAGALHLHGPRFREASTRRDLNRCDTVHAEASLVVMGYTAQARFLRYARLMTILPNGPLSRWSNAAGASAKS